MTETADTPIVGECSECGMVEGHVLPHGTCPKETLGDYNLASLARMIYADWSKRGKGVNFAAVPYLKAMGTLDTLESNYGYDSGRSIVVYFLSNAGSWRGDVARAVKAELKRRLK